MQEKVNKPIAEGAEGYQKRGLSNFLDKSWRGLVFGMIPPNGLLSFLQLD